MDVKIQVRFLREMLGKINKLTLTDLSAKPGDYVHPYTGANMSLGDMFFRFDSREELDDVMSRVNEWLHIELE